MPSRAQYLEMSDDELLRHCDTDTHRVRGPGGQHRNTTESAVRLVLHERPEIVAIANEERSQHRNRAVALKRLRLALARQWREEDQPPRWEGDWKVSVKNPRYPALVAVLLDALYLEGYGVSEAARRLGLSTGQLVRLLARDPQLWREVDQQRQRRHLKPLTAP